MIGLKWFKKKESTTNKSISDYKIVEIIGFNPSAGKSIVEIKSLDDFISLTDVSAVIYLSDGVFIQEFPEAILTCRKQ